MTAGSLIIYLFADIRKLARENKLGGVALESLRAPLTAEETLAIIKSNKEILEESALLGRDDIEDILKALKHMQAHNSEEGRDDESRTSSNFWNLGLSSFFQKAAATSQKEAKSAVMTHFVDDNANEEIVHAIVVNQDRKRVTVVFRGSATQKDFIQDAKISQKKVENPVFEMMEDARGRGMPETINFHAGFYQYLHKKDKTTGKTRIQQILEDAKSELAKNPNFQLFVTGHSLGGALSTMFGFFAAADNEIIQLSPKGVVVYSVASPFVGNWKFREAFQELERRGRLQHLRICNAEDMVTLMPFAAPKAGIMSPAISMVSGAGNLYKHVGMRLQLTESNIDDGRALPFSIVYPVNQRMDDEEFAKEVQDILSAGKSLVKAFAAVATNNFEVVGRHHR